MTTDVNLPRVESAFVGAERAAHPGRRAALARFVRRKPLGAIGGPLLALAVLWAIFAPQIAPYDFNATDLSARLEGPSLSHLFGTDELGRDLFSRVTYGSRVSITIAIVGVTFAT